MKSVAAFLSSLLIVAAVLDAQTVNFEDVVPLGMKVSGTVDPNNPNESWTASFDATQRNCYGNRSQ